MKDARLREPVVGEPFHSLPCGVVPLTASPERASPEVDYMVPESAQGPIVGRDCVIVEEAVHDIPQPGPLFGDRPVHPPSHLFLKFRQLRLHPVAACLAHEQKLAPAGFPADEGEAEKAEGLRFSEPALRALRRRVAAKRDQTGFLRMQPQRKLE
jgi:hypothetical protein